MPDLPKTYFSSSAGKDILISEMSYPQLLNTTNAYARRIGGGTDPTLEALRAELASQPPPDESSAAEGTARSPGARKLDQAPPADPRGLAKIGHNNPPDETLADRLTARLEAQYAALLEEIAEHELKAAKLPKVVNSDEDLGAINAWVKTARDLYRRAEANRKTEKEDFLQAGKAIDAFFKSVQEDVTKRAVSLEERNTPYLAAKAAAEKARLEAEAKAKREAAEVARLAEEEARVAGREAKVESAAAEQAAKDVKRAEKSADRDEKVAAGGGRHALGRTSAGGGSSTLKTVWKYRITDRAAFVATLGPLHSFITPQAIEDALDRAAKALSKPEISGVEIYPETASSTR